MAEKRMIGYLLKELDRLINERFEEDLAAGELSRRHWQMVHFLAGGTRAAAEVRDGLAPFWEHHGEWEAELAELVDRGLIVDNAGTLGLTEAGHTVHDQAFVRIGKRRRAMVEGITDERYAETIRTLERMVANMSGAQVAGR
ncbi:MarR family transcriptional regulator [Nocardia sp. NPDC052112]|uniref:MarR family transcriptional regulator n=1 Tax=Nocardia sp. NPDC052112 TaxID=3155646 RepID=UPI00343FB35F